ELSDALPEPDAEDPARREPEHRLNGLEAGALRVVPRVEEAEDSGAAVRLEPDRKQADDRSEREPAAENADRSAGHEQHSGQHQDEHDRRAEIGLGEQEHAEDAGQEADRTPELLERMRRLSPREVARSPDGERELGELRRLKDGGPKGDPTARA